MLCYQTVMAAIKVTARNVTNVEEIDKYVQSLLDRAKTDQAKKWLTKTFRKYLINNHEAAPVTNPSSKYPDYINDAITNGQEVFYVKNLDKIPIRPVIDYLNTLDEINFGFDQAIKKSEQYHTNLAQKAGKYSDKDDSSEIIHTYKNGYSWRLLKTKSDYVREGDIMGHCVGDYNPEDETKIFSLRSPVNQPKVTVELYEGDPSKYTIEQVKGKANTVPFKYKKYVVHFMEQIIGEDKLEIEDPEGDLENLGIISLKGKFLLHPEELIGIDFEKVHDGYDLDKENVLVKLSKVGLFVHNETIFHGDNIVNTSNKVELMGIENIILLNALKNKYFIRENGTLKNVTKDLEFPISRFINGSFVITKDNVNDLLLANKTNFVSLNRKTAVHFSSVTLDNYDEIYASLLDQITARGYIVSSKGIMSLAETRQNKLPICDGFTIKKNDPYITKSIVSNLSRSGFVLYGKDKVLLLTEKEAMKLLTKSGKETYRFKSDTRNIGRYDIRGMVDDSLMHFMQTATPENLGVPFVLDHNEIIPFSKLTGKVAKRINRYELIIDGEEVKDIPKSFWVNAENFDRLSVRNSKLKIPNLIAKQVAFFDCEIDINNAETRYFQLGNSKGIVGKLDSSNLGLMESELSAKTLVNQNLVTLTEDSKLIVNYTNTGELSADNSIMQVTNWSPNTGVPNVTVSRKAKINITNYSGPEMMERDVIVQSGGTINDHNHPTSVVRSLMSKDVLFTATIFKKIGYVEMPDFLVALKYDVKTQYNFREMVSSNRSKRLWEVQILYKRKVIAMFYFTVTEIKKLFSEKVIFREFTRKANKINKHKEITTKDFENSLFNNNIVGKNMTKGYR